MNESILNAMNWRYAVKEFDSTKKVSDEDFHTILESARLAPSTIGLEPWKFIVVKNPEVRSQLSTAGYGQSKITDGSHLVVIAARTDADVLADELVERTAAATEKTLESLAGLRAMAEGSVAGHRSSPEVLHGWLKGQTYIPLGIMIETAALLGIDAGPMEGFDAAAVDEILGLKDKNLQSVTMIAFGYRGDDAYAGQTKTRRSFAEVVEVVA